MKITILNALTGGLLALVLSTGLYAQSQMATTSTVQPPLAKKNPKQLTMHGVTRTDNYYWLNKREDPEVIAYLNAENDYLKQKMAHTEPLQEKLYGEMRGRVKEDDSSVPFRQDGYYYYTRYEKGGEYPLYCRRKGSLTAPEEVMVNGNEMGKGKGYFAISTWEVSPDGNLLAFAIDTLGRRIYNIQFKDLRTGKLLPDIIRATTPNLAWSTDNQTVFYTKQDLQTLRWEKVYRHKLAADPAKDVLVFHEKDDTFYAGVSRSKSRKYIIIGSGNNSSMTSESLYLEAANPTGSFKVFLPRQKGHQYDLDHADGKFYIRTNDGAQNFKLMATAEGNPAKANWKEVVPHRPDVLLEGFELFKEYLVLQERGNALTRIQVRPWAGGGDHFLDFGEPAYTASVAFNPEYDTKTLRYNYTSMTTPQSVYDYDMAARTRQLMKQTEVLGGFDSKNYQTERLFATAPDGTKVPISLVYRKGIKKDGSNPLLVYGYGSYGISMDPSFSSSSLSLLDRGFVYAIAHIRGGQEMGRAWYEDGKLYKKKNTFTDFIACTEYLQKEGFSRPERTFAMGGSAGGLLMGAVMNMRPDLYKGIIAAVPFVDVVTTMLDSSIPLTTNEYDEWGNPGEKGYFDYMLAYSPYDHVEGKSYPNLLVTTGLHDSQVQYWEPAKWVAKLRDTKKDNNLLLLHTNMEAGHGGASGRFRRYKETALQYAFLLDQAGIKEQ
ncbi:MAG: S9 family peptidase [Cytophagales bacterium]|nr:S9 family peptidase [Cytophagales bacterium]